MPKLHLTPKEASVVKARRARNKSWNTAVMATVEVVKKRLKKADELETQLLHSVLGDLRRMVR